MTGFVFFIKPGYREAYAPLRVRALPLEGTPLPAAHKEWLEARAMRTVLGGMHLLVRTESGWLHLDPATLEARAMPDEPDIRALLGDAIGASPTAASRYGEIATVVRGDDGSAAAQTTTGVTIDLDWATLGLSQSGRDTRRIDALYRIHYLQWTGISAVDRILGVAGLLSLLALAFFGLRLAFRRAS